MSFAIGTRMKNPEIHTRRFAYLWHPATSALETLGGDFPPICLKEMADVTLLNRIDIKFLMPMEQLLSVLVDLPRQYHVLLADHRQPIPYRTLYFDTPDFALYQAHVNGKAGR
jgi:hypothetical protein